MRIEKLTTHIGAELSGVNIAEAAKSDDLFAEIRTALLNHKVLFLRDQDISRADHVAFAERFGALEDHPVAGSDPENPGLVRIYKDENSPPDYYENSWHADATWREAPQMGAVLRCIACPPEGGDTMWANMELNIRWFARIQKQDAKRCSSVASRRISPISTQQTMFDTARIMRRGRASYWHI